MTIEVGALLAATHPMFATVNERVEYIAGLMERNVWHTRRTKRELASCWGVSPSAIQNYSAEAGRMIGDGIRERRAAIAYRAVKRLERDAKDFAASGVPGDAGAAVKCNDILLKVAGFAEPEEDKQKGPPQLFPVGTVVNSPVFNVLLSGRQQKQLNGKAEPAIGQSSEGADDLPDPAGDGAVVPTKH